MKSPRRQRHADAWKAAEAYGCDMSLIEENLRKTPQERLRAHNQALKSLLAIREAAGKCHGRS
jgi:hypothetical protein